MESWTLLQIIISLALAIFIPAFLIKFTLGKNGGHHLYDKELSPDQIKKLPFTFAYTNAKNKLVGSLITLVGLSFVLLLLNFVCNAFGLANNQKNFWIGVYFASLFFFLLFRFLKIKSKK